MRRVRVLVAALVVVGATCSYGAPVASAVEAPASSVVAQPGAAVSGLVDPLAGLVTNGPIYDIERVGTTTYLGGDFDYIGERTGSFVGLSAASGARTQVFPQIQGTMFAVESDGSGGWYQAGVFNRADGGFSGIERISSTFTGIERISSTGDLIWRRDIFGEVRDITDIGSALIISGSFASVGDVDRPGLAAIDPQTGALLPWNPQLPQTQYLYNAYGDGVVYVGRMTGFGSGPVQAVSYPSGVVRPFNVLVQRVDRDMDYYDGFLLTSSGAFNDLGESVEAPCMGTAGVIAGRWGNILFKGGVGCDLTTGVQVFSSPFGGDHASSDGESVYIATGSNLRAYDFATGADRGWVVQANRTFTDIAVSGQTVAVSAGGASSIGIVGRSNLAAIDGDGHLTSWDPSADGTVRSLSADGSELVIGGDFTQVGGVGRGHLARVDVATGSLGAWNPGADGPVNAVAVAGAVTYAGGSFTNVGGESHARLAAIGADGHPVSSFAATANSTVTTVEAAGDRLYVGGAFSRVNGETRSRIAAVDAITGALASWNPGADDFVRSIAATNDTVYVGGAFTTAGGQPRDRVAALDRSTGAATPWNPGADNQVWSVAVDGDLVYLGGMFSQAGGVARSSLAAVTVGGTLVDWDPSPSGAVYSIVAAGGVVSAAGLFGTAAVAPAAGSADADAPGGRDDVAAAALPGDAQSASFAQYPAAEAPGSVSGTVTESGSGSPVAGAWVAVLRTSDFSAAGGATANAGGDFTTQVPPGSYYLYLIDPAGAHTAGFFGSPTAVTVIAGNTVDADPALAPTRGSVTGTITEDGTANPVAGAWAIAINASNGAPETGALANGSGQYSLADLRTGNHLMVYVDPAGGHSTEFYANSSDAAHANPIAVTAGGSAVANDSMATQAATPGGSTLSGTVTETATNTPLGGVAVMALRAADFRLARATITNTTGTYNLNLQVGGYKLVFLDGTGRHNTEWHNNLPYNGLANAVTVTAPAVTNAVLDRNTGTMAGLVTDVPSGTAVAGAWVIAIGPTGIAGGVTTAANGTYTIAGLPAGTYRAAFIDPTGDHDLEYHNNAASYAGATPFAVTAANTTTINAALAP